MLYENQELVAGLKPEELWKMFAVVSSVPRGSKNEKQITNLILDYAKTHSVPVVFDVAGNVLATVPASPEMETMPSICLQAHIDMVCEKTPGSFHDFNEDSIEFVLQGEFLEQKLSANGTSLGADNGIGVAAMLVLMTEPAIKHGPLELLFTVDEETGLNGASKLAVGPLKSKILINLDSEDWGEFYISSAGGMRTKISLPLSSADTHYDTPTVKITVAGLKGGHSGVQINRPHENPIKILGRLIRKITANNLAGLTKIEGGEKFNAIPREAFAEFAVTRSQIPALKGIVTKFTKMIQEEIGSFEPDFKIVVETIKKGNETVVTPGSTQKICDLISLIPHGVIRMSPNMSDLVQTSNNLASIKMKNWMVIFQTMQRGAINSEVKEVVNCIDASAKRCAGYTTHSGWYSGWKANPDSAILKLAEKVFFDLFKEDATVKAIHAGLECGVLAGKYPGIDILSFGPTIKNPHSPDEYVDVLSVKNFWEFLLTLLRAVPEINQG